VSVLGPRGNFHTIRLECWTSLAVRLSASIVRSIASSLYATTSTCGSHSLILFFLPPSRLGKEAHQGRVVEPIKAAHVARG
jgi:hypothetical protein